MSPRHDRCVTSRSATAASTTPGFAASAALDDCESGWDHTLRAKSETAAVHGDTLIVRAKAYHDMEIANLTKFEDR